MCTYVNTESSVTETTSEESREAHLQVDLACARELQLAAACILDLRATITRLMGELQTVTAERDALQEQHDLAYQLHLRQALRP